MVSALTPAARATSLVRMTDCTRGLARLTLERVPALILSLRGKEAKRMRLDRAVMILSAVGVLGALAAGAQEQEPSECPMHATHQGARDEHGRGSTRGMML
jgi:hypothetical protein